MNTRDPLDELLKKWELKSPHSTAKFVSDTLRAIRVRETRPGWRITWDGWLEGADDWMGEWLPSPRVLLPVAASLILLVVSLQWAKAGRQAEAVAAFRWQQEMTQPMGQGSLSGDYARFIRE